MKRILIGLLVWTGFAWGQITTVPNAAQILGVGGLSCSLGVCTVYTATGPNTLVVQAGSAQGTTDLVQVKSVAGAVLGNVTYAGAFVGPAGYFGPTSGVGMIYVGQSQLLFPSDVSVKFSSTTTYNGTPDLSLLRKSVGLLKVGDGSTGYGSVEANNLTAVALATPAAPTVTPTCAADCTAPAWTYTVTALAGDGTTTVPGATGTTAANAVTLDANNYNTVTWAAVTGATKYTVRRTVSGGTPATLGALATCTSITGLSCTDNGLVGDASAAPTANTTGRGLFGGSRVSVGTPTSSPNSFISTIELNGTNSSIVVGSNSSGGTQFELGSENISGGRFGLFSGTTRIMTLLGSGSVGVGTLAPDRLLHAELSDAATNAVSYVQRLSHITSGTAAAGFGAGLEMELENASGNNVVASTIETAWTTATNGAEDSYLTLNVVAAGTLGQGLRINKDKTVLLPGYSGTGQMFACFDANGQLVRSATICAAP